MTTRIQVHKVERPRRSLEQQPVPDYYIARAEGAGELYAFRERSRRWRPEVIAEVPRDPAVEISRPMVNAGWLGKWLKAALREQFGEFKVADLNFGYERRAMRVLTARLHHGIIHTRTVGEDIWHGEAFAWVVGTRGGQVEVRMCLLEEPFPEEAPKTADVPLVIQDALRERYGVFRLE